MAARPRTLPAAIAPVLVGTAAAIEQRGRPAARRGVHRRADRLDLHPDRDQPRQRLLGRQARRRHRRPARPGAGHLRRTGRAAQRADRDLARLRRRGGRRDLPGHGRRLGDHRRRRRLDRRRRPLHRRPSALRLRRTRRAVRLPLLRPGRRERLLLRAARAARLAAVRALGRRRLSGHGDPGRQQRPGHRDRPPRRQAHARRAPRAAAGQEPLRRAPGRGLCGAARDRDQPRRPLVGAARPPLGAARACAPPAPS